MNFTRTCLCAGLLAAAWTAPAAATSLALTKSFEGNINFVGTQASLQSKSGGAKACDLSTSVQAGLTLPARASVVSATLYWAGTGTTVDPEVLLNGSKVSAPVERRYGSSIDGLSYFAAAADVTALVQGKTSFTFGGLEVSKADIYCSNKQKENAMVAGFALAVVYAHESERYRTVNVYEGLHALKNSSVTVAMPDYTPPASNTGSGRFGYIVWEGDKTGQQKDDSVSFAGQYLHYPPFVQKGDAFNSKSSANSDENAGGIDFDIVDLAAPPAVPSAANAVFSTAADRVLLGAAIVALPSKPADLAIRKTQSGEFKTGNEVTYTLTVSNEGARADSKVEVRDTLPDALAYVSAAGADWTCSVAGQAVSCKYGKPLAPGASASVQIKAKITGSGKIANTAEVVGSADGVPGNNRSTVEGDAGGQVSKDPFVFTTGPCLADTVIKASGSGCALFTGPVVAGSKPVIYLTHAVDGIARPLSTTSKTGKSVRFSLECNNPASSAGATASYAGVALATCLANDTPVTATVGKDATLEFAANEVSKATEFHYPDVGRVTLRMRDADGSIAKASFVSLPQTLRATYKRGDGVLNPGKAALSEAAFAEAGEPFLVVVSAHGQDGIGPLPNFGRETGEFVLAGKLSVLAQGGDLEQRLLQEQDNWSGAGSVARTHVWNEAGMAQLAASLEGYLGSDQVLGTGYTTVGRFYPAYFTTRAEGSFACLKRMQCPAGAPQPITRASFSGQPFAASVRAHGRNGPLQRFAGALLPQITLSAVSAAGENGKELDKFSNGGPAANTERQVGYRLAKGYDAKANTRDWTPPTAVHVRAVAQELRKTSGGVEVRAISSLREKGVDASEGGIMVVNGRLMVSNTIGTPLSKTLVPLRAQYWSGMAWEQNGLLDELEAPSGSVEFSGCRRSLRLNAGLSDACDPAIVKLVGATSGNGQVLLPMLKDGKANLVLAPIGERSGNVDVFVNGREYLPSTFGRVTFGQFKSPVIYIREMY
jgi:uncharacterized repeat protein (TIGR01451 family)